MKVWSWRDAIRMGDLEPTTKLVLYTISVYMNELGSGAFPSYGTLATDCQLKKNTVMKHVKIAVEKGFLRKEKCARENGSTTSNKYFALYPQGVHLHQLGGSPQSTPTSSPASTPINTTVSNTPEKEKEVTKVTSKKHIAKKPDCVSQELWSEFMDYRRGKQARLTPTALKGFEREAAKAMITLEEAFEHTMLMGWRGFKSEWYNNQKGKNNGNGFNNKKTRGQQSDETIFEVLHSRHLEREQGS